MQNSAWNNKQSGVARRFRLKEWLLSHSGTEQASLRASLGHPSKGSPIRSLMAAANLGSVCPLEGVSVFELIHRLVISNVKGDGEHSRNQRPRNKEAWPC